MIDIGKNAQKASKECALLTNDDKNKVLTTIASNLLKKASFIKEANQKDVQVAHENNLSSAMIDRLLLDDQRIKAMANGLIDIASFPDPIGEILEESTLDNGLLIEKISVPLGVIGIIYESRPNVTVDAFGLCFKAGNAVILKGGKEAINSNIALETIIKESLHDCSCDQNMIQVIQSTERKTTHEMMKMNQYIDVLIPRGSQGLINAVVKNSTIPVIQTGAGNCHIYVDEDANLDMALKIIENAKCQRLGVCNAMEALVVHQKIAQKLLPKLANQLEGVSFYADEAARKIVDTFKAASEEDYAKEYLDKAMSVKTVHSLDEAIEHINHYNTKHSESIITNNSLHAQRFCKEIDSSAVYVNASTRFTDGSEFGFGAEIGISTQKLHARGPMGLKQLRSYKYIIKGKGQTRV